MGAMFLQSRSNATYQWCAEGRPIAARAHLAFWCALGCTPRRWDRAEDTGLANEEHHVDIEFLTLRYCALYGDEHSMICNSSATACMPVSAGVHPSHRRTEIFLVVAMQPCVSCRRSSQGYVNVLHGL